MLGPKAKLLWDVWKECNKSFEEYMFSKFTKSGKEADRTVIFGKSGIGAGFFNRHNYGFFPGFWEIMVFKNCVN